MRPERSSIACAYIAGGLLLAGCAARTDVARVPATPVNEMRREDTLWLERVSFGLDSASVEGYRQLGRERVSRAAIASRRARIAGTDSRRDCST